MVKVGDKVKCIRLGSIPEGLSVGSFYVVKQVNNDMSVYVDDDECEHNVLFKNEYEVVNED